MIDIRLRNGIIVITFIFGIVFLFIVYGSCNKPPQPVVIGERTRSKRITETKVNAIPPQRIDSAPAVQIRWRTQYRDRYIHDTVGYIAVSDSIRGKGGTVFVVEYDTYKRSFDVPYLLERPDTTRIVTDSVFVERTVQAESSFWDDVGKVAGGFLGGFILGGGLK